MQKLTFQADQNRCKNAILDEKSVSADPFRQFASWFKDAVFSGVPEPEAMFLASAGETGIPSARIVLLKGFDDDGFVFFTDYNSRKGFEININPFVAVVFHWKEITRQVRISGKAHQVAPAESDAYFSSRPMESRISAIVSSQGTNIPSRSFLEEQFVIKKREYEGREPERPAHWGGFRIVPAVFEFWQSREHRLHDRIQYRFIENKWTIERISP